MNKFNIKTNLTYQERNETLSGVGSRSLEFHEQSFKGKGYIVGRGCSKGRSKGLSELCG